MGAAARDPTARTHFILAFWHFGILKSTRACTADPLPLAPSGTAAYYCSTTASGLGIRLGTRDAGLGTRGR